MHRTTSSLALGTAVFVLAVHLTAIFGYAPLGMAPVFPAFLIGILCFGSFIVDHRNRVPGVSHLLTFEDWPPWAGTLIVVTFVYAGVNFAWFFHATGGGTLEYLAGQPYLSDHGRFIRRLDPSGVRAFRAWQVRLFSGHIMPFLVLPGLYFRFESQKARIE